MKIKDPTRCILCGAPLSPETFKCSRCGMQYESLNNLPKSSKEILSELFKPQKIPLDFWSNETILYAIDLSDYFDLFLNTTRTTLRNIKDDKSFLKKKGKKPKAAKVQLLKRREYWYLLKFFFIKSEYVKLGLESKKAKDNILQVGGIPKGTKIQCTCGKLIDDQLFVRGTYRMPKNVPADAPLHGFFLRISKPCPKCGNILVVYRPKSGIFTALMLFLNHLDPNRDYELKSDFDMIIFWVTTVIDAIYKDKFSMFRLYHQDIKKFWDFIMEHPILDPKVKESIKSEFNLGKVLKAYPNIKDLSEQKQTEIIERLLKSKKSHPKEESLKDDLNGMGYFLSKNLIVSHDDLNPYLSGEKKFSGDMDKLIVRISLIQSWLEFYDVLNLVIFRNESPRNITVLLEYISEKTNKVRNMDEGYMKYYKWLLDSFLAILKDHNIQKVTQLDNSIQEFLKMRKRGHWDLIMNQIGAIIINAWEFVEREKILFRGDTISTLDKIYHSLGFFIYASKRLDIINEIRKLKNSVTLNRDSKFNYINEEILNLINICEQYIDKSEG